jgi:predicted AAA+ superfamily ATPase
MLIKRDQFINKLKELSVVFPVMGIIGPRQSGKTTLVKEFVKDITKPVVYLDLEIPSNLAKLGEAELFLTGSDKSCVIIDEVQRRPDLFSLLRALTDQNRTPLRFIILGSATPELLRQSSESLAGRIAYLELTPFNLLEINEKISLRDHHFFGGFPEAILNTGSGNLWLDHFITTYLERDLPLLGLSASSILMRKLWEMVAWTNGNLLNLSELAKSLSVSYHVVNRYIDYLENAFMVHRLRPYSVNIKKKLVRAPKIYIRDTGILHRLLGLSDFEQLSGHPKLGSSWEAYVLNQILSRKDRQPDIHFFRSHAGAETDLVFVRGGVPVATAEIKYTSSPEVSRGFRNCIDDLKSKKNFIIVPKDEEYPAGKDILVTGVKVFLEKYLEGIQT